MSATQTSSRSQHKRCAVCDKEVKPQESLYPTETQEAQTHFCSPACKTAHERKAAPSKQDVDNQQR